MVYTSRHDGTTFFLAIFMIGPYGRNLKKYLTDIPETEKWSIPVSYSAGWQFGIWVIFSEKNFIIFQKKNLKFSQEKNTELFKNR